MHLGYFGDTYDLAKRFLMQCLAPKGPWGIVPMFTDDWSDAQIAEYERLLGGTVLNTNCIKGTRNRHQATTAGDWNGHVFIDPDTGVPLPDSDERSTSHLLLDEIVREAMERPEHIILVFDQSYANAKLRNKVEPMKQKLAHLEGKGIECFGYLGQASFLILSCDSDALEQAKRNLLDAGVPSNRLISLP